MGSQQASDLKAVRQLLKSLPPEKTCTKCNESKRLGSFHKNRSTKDGLAGRCKPCVSEQQRDYRKRNREKIREYNREWREANPEYHREYQAANPEKVREYQAANPEKVRVYQRKYRAANPENVREYGRRYYEANRDKAREYGRRYYEANRDKAREYGRRYYEANRDKARKRALALIQSPIIVMPSTSILPPIFSAPGMVGGEGASIGQGGGQ